jgi:nucleoside-diphosphate-sugar epimerase
MAAVESGRVCVFGAGGPVGAVVYAALRGRYTVRLTDVAPYEEVASRPASPLWPRGERPDPPDEWMLCDVTDLRQVERALEGCDAAINLTVNRSNTELAFRVNVGGAYNIMKAAVAQGVSRVIHTGPWARVNGYEGDYRYEYAVADDVPYRAGTQLYPHTKGLSLDVVDAFAEGAGLDVMTFWLSRLRPADAYDGRDDDVLMSFSVAWSDLGRAFMCGLQAPSLPHPNEEFFICARLPMDKYRPDKAERLLGWRAESTFERFCTEEPPGGWPWLEAEGR